MPKKIAKGIKKVFSFVNPVGVIARLYINYLNRREFQNPPFTVFNERPVEYRFVFEQITKFYPKKVLDVGTGVTALPHLMANCGCSVTAMDNIKDYWPHGMFNRHFYVINDDITNPTIKDSFDLITCVSTLEHIENFDKAVDAMFLLLRPGGFLILTFPYNEHAFVDNVYALPGSNTAGKLPPFKTHAYSRRQIDSWMEGKADVLEQEYWQFYTGDYWTVGDRVTIPKQVSKDDTHQISCVLFKKRQ